MTNATLVALAEVLRVHEDNDDYIYAVIEALEKYRADGGPMAESTLRNACEDYVEQVNRPWNA